MARWLVRSAAEVAACTGRQGVRWTAAAATVATKRRPRDCCPAATARRCAVAWAACCAAAHTGTANAFQISSPLGPAWAWSLCISSGLLFLVLTLYTVRHYVFSLNRLFGAQRHPYSSIVSADWPQVTVLVAAHNEEAVIADCLENLMAVDYPPDRMVVMPVNDRSSDRTREIIDAVNSKYPGRIRPFHRVGGKPGKAAALKEASELVETGFIVVFDADYLPCRGLIRRLMAPFVDPEVGAVMGRVVPNNVAANLLTRLLDLERSGGYQVDQQARMNLGLLPQYGGTVGGIRMKALKAAGGWHDDVLAEDTDLTYRLRLKGWLTVYHNRSECYEEVPESWAVRVRQIKRWAKGHNQALVRHSLPLLRNRQIRLVERIDGLLLLGVYLMSPMLIVGWLLGVLLYFTVAMEVAAPAVFLLALMSHSAMGNFAAFFEIAAAVHLDRSHRRIRLLAFNWLGFVVSATAIVRSIFEQALLDRLAGRKFHWDKTVRYRRSAAVPQVSPRTQP